MRKSTIARLVGVMVAAGLGAALTAGASAQAPSSPTTSLLPAILKAFEQAYPGATISATSQERHNGKTAVRVQSVDKGRRRSVLYEPGGAVIEVAEQIEEKELPAPVAAAMRSHPRAIFVSATKVTRGGTVQYQLLLRGTRKTTLIARPDGTVVSFK
jgi:hypothetical protein